MAGHFFLHFGQGFESHARVQALHAPALHAMGMRPLATVGHAALYTSDQASILQLPGGSVVVGELFFRGGERIINAAQIPPPSSTKTIRDYIVSNCWGDYVLVQPEGSDRRAFTVLRSPSHARDLQCLYHVDREEGFVTSDITLATRLQILERRIDFSAIAHRLFYPDLKTATTALVGISELLPGSVLHLGTGRHTITQAWTPWNFVATDGRHTDFGEAASAVRQAVQTTVRALAILDKEVMLELSGGLDSSIVGACLRLVGTKVSCQTLTLPVPGADERSYATTVATMLGVELYAAELGFDTASLEYAVPLELTTPAVGVLQFAVDRIMQQAASFHGTSSFFSGAGGDTVFGYLPNAAPAADAFRAAGPIAGLRAIRDLSDFHQCTYWRTARLAMRKLIASAKPAAPDRLLISPTLQTPVPELHPWDLSPPGALPGDRQRISELASTQLFREVCIRGLDRPFRMPLLSQPVIEACLRVPSWMWFEGGHNRAVARRAFADMLPANVLHRKSKGTFTAYLGSLYRRRRTEILDFLREGELQARGMLDADALRRLANDNRPADEATFMRVFQLCAVENWVRQQPRPCRR